MDVHCTVYILNKSMMINPEMRHFFHEDFAELVVILFNCPKGHK